MKKTSRKINRGFIYFLALMLVVLSVPLAAMAAPQDKVRVFIGFNEMPGRAEEALVRSFGGEIRHTYSIIPSISAELPVKAIEALQKNPKVRIIEPVVTAYAIGTYEEELSETWGMARIGEGVAQTTNGALGSGVKVAIIDSGIDYTHPEFDGIYAGGYDFVNNDNDPMDIDGHGTHVAGTVAAAKDGSGVVGAAPSVELYALKALEGGSGGFDDIVAALDWCVVKGIDITNNSYGSSTDPGDTVEAAFDAAYNKGVLHIAAAGNEGTPPGKGDTVGYPAKYSSVVAVAASNVSDSRARFSSTGPDVDLIAPGEGILSTYIGGQYATMSGTSMASPHVAGVAAQVLGVNPSFSPDQIKQKLIDTAEDLGLPYEHQGHGLVRADLATEVGGLTPDPDPVVQYTLTVNKVGEGTVTVTPSTEDYKYDAGTIVQLVATPADGYEFEKWDVGTEGYTNANIEITMNSDTIAIAYFAQSEPDPNPDPVEVTLTASLDKEDPAVYSGNAWVYITSTLKDGDVGVPGAEITATVTNPSGESSKVSGITNSDGIAILKYRLVKNFAKGAYSIQVYAGVQTDPESVTLGFEYK